MFKQNFCGVLFNHKFGVHGPKIKKINLFDSYLLIYISSFMIQFTPMNNKTETLFIVGLFCWIKYSQ